MSRAQTTPYLLMVRPAQFGFNAETAENNAFQSKDQQLTAAQIREKAIEEFDEFVAKLRAVGVEVVVAEDTPEPAKPDAVFPNNWVSFHQEGHIITYPMFAPTRRQERSDTILETVLHAGFQSTGTRWHLEQEEANNHFLEGTGSIIFDHSNRLAYACLSPRTDAELLTKLCDYLGYQAVVFHSVDAAGQAVYHTNVMMAIGESFVVICLESVRQPEEKEMLRNLFTKTNKEVIEISLEQMNSFAGNMLQVRNKKEETFLVMSETAYHSLTQSQLERLRSHTKLLYSALPTIERYGGGSARCMLAEIFLPKKSN